MKNQNDTPYSTMINDKESSSCCASPSNRRRKKANVKAFLGVAVGRSNSFQSLEDDNEDEDYPHDEVNPPPTHLQGDSSISSTSLPPLEDIPECAQFSPNRGGDEEEASSHDDTCDQSLSSQPPLSPNYQSISTIELDTDLYDMDNYMLSVFQLDESSVYTKGTASTTNTSTTSSSVVSTRSRHRGAYYHSRARQKPSSPTSAANTTRSWLDTMQQQSLQAGLSLHWTCQGGWKQWNDDDDKGNNSLGRRNMAVEAAVAANTALSLSSSSWDGTPEALWEHRNPVFDAIPRERIEI